MHDRSTWWIGLAALLAGCIAPDVGAQIDEDGLGPKLSGWNYHTAARPLAARHADPGTRLTDDETGRNSELMIVRAGTVALGIELDFPSRLQSIQIHQHRHNLNYKMDHLAVCTRRAGMWVEQGPSIGVLQPDRDHGLHPHDPIEWPRDGGAAPGVRGRGRAQPV